LRRDSSSECSGSCSTVLRTGGVSRTGFGDTLETSVCALRLFPTAEGPQTRSVTPLVLERIAAIRALSATSRHNPNQANPWLRQDTAFTNVRNGCSPCSMGISCRVDVDRPDHPEPESSCPTPPSALRGGCGWPVIWTFGCREQPKSAQGRLERVRITGQPYPPSPAPQNHGA
jgi:hypothetical protein